VNEDDTAIQNTAKIRTTMNELGKSVFKSFKTTL